MFESNDAVTVKGGETYWGRNKVAKCEKCGIAAVNVDDCGEFGNPYCPCYGVKGGEIEPEEYKSPCNK